MVVATDEGVTFGVAWPSGRTEWDPVTGVIRVNEDTATIGDRVGVGGAAYDVDPERIGDFDWAHPPELECLGDRFWLAMGITTDLSGLE